MFLSTIKSAAIAIAATSALAFAALGTSAGSYAKTLIQGIGEWIEGEIPLDLVIARAVDLARAIDPEIERGKVDVARAEVAVESLEREVAAGQEKVAAGEQTLARASEVARASCRTSVGERVARELQQAFEAFRRDEQLLAAKVALLERQRKAVDAAKQKLCAVSAERERILEAIEHLKIQQMILEATAAGSPSFALDDSPLGEAKRLVAEVQNRLAVWEKLLAHAAAPSIEEGEPSELLVLVSEIEEHLAER